MYTPATYSLRLHQNLHIEDYRFGRANSLRRAADIRRALRSLPAGSIPFNRTLISLRAQQQRMADLRSVCNPARVLAVMERDLAAVISPASERFQADFAAVFGKVA